MNNPRTLLVVALLALAYLLFLAWQEDYGAHPAPPTSPAVATAPASTAGEKASSGASTVPAAESPTLPKPPAVPNGATESPGQEITVTTDVLRVTIDSRGGSIVRADLLAYPQHSGKGSPPFRLLDNTPAAFFEAQSGLVSNTGSAPDHRAMFTAERTTYSLAPGAGSIDVPLTWTGPDGLAVTRNLIFHRGSYVIDQRQVIENRGTAPWTGNAYRQLQRVPPVIETGGLKGYANTDRYSFSGAAWYSATDKFQKLKYDKFASDPLSESFSGGWAAMLQHYFFAAWIPPAKETDSYSTDTVDAGGTHRYLIRAMSPVLTVAPGAQAETTARLYIGPKLQGTLDSIAPGLALTADYGIFTVIAEPLHWILSQFHKLTGNWGFAIILLVLLIKAVFFKLSEAQYRSMARMRKLQPRIAALKERFGDDRQKMNQAMMELYKTEKVNPLGGCLPMLVQIPVFFALYWVLIESVELRQAPFIGWIHDLTAPDPYYVLPILNAAIMFVSQHLTPTSGMDPMQARMMKIMPIAFSIIFIFFPAGLVLYYVANGGLSLLQQWIITRRVEAGERKAG